MMVVGKTLKILQRSYDDHDEDDDDDSDNDDDDDNVNLEDFFAKEHFPVNEDSSQLSKLEKNYLVHCAKRVNEKSSPLSIVLHESIVLEEFIKQTKTIVDCTEIVYCAINHSLCTLNQNHDQFYQQHYHFLQNYHQHLK